MKPPDATAYIGGNNPVRKRNLEVRIFVISIRNEIDSGPEIMNEAQKAGGLQNVHTGHGRHRRPSLLSSRFGFSPGEYQCRH